MIAGDQFNQIASSKRTYVKKWIDYSNKFGFGYQLNDNSIGVIFNDGIRIKSQQDKNNIVTAVFDGTVQTKKFNGNIPKEYRGRNKLLHHFKQYMEENLADSIPKEEINGFVEPHLSKGEQTRKTNILYLKGHFTRNKKKILNFLPKINFKKVYLYHLLTVQNIELLQITNTNRN